MTGILEMSAEQERDNLLRDMKRVFRMIDKVEQYANDDNYSNSALKMLYEWRDGVRREWSAMKKDEEHKAREKNEYDISELSEQGILAPNFIDMAEALAKKVGAKDRFDMFRRFESDEYDGLDVELTISAYKHLLGE